MNERLGMFAVGRGSNRAVAEARQGAQDTMLVRLRTGCFSEPALALLYRKVSRGAPWVGVLTRAPGFPRRRRIAMAAAAAMRLPLGRMHGSRHRVSRQRRRLSKLPTLVLQPQEVTGASMGAAQIAREQAPVACLTRHLTVAFPTSCGRGAALWRPVTSKQRCHLDPAGYHLGL